jgi:hypothetical protein
LICPFTAQPANADNALFAAIKKNDKDAVATVSHNNHALLFDMNKDGDYPIHAAVKTGELDLVKLLADPSTVNLRDNNGFTPAYLAKIYNNDEISKFLIENGGIRETGKLFTSSVMYVLNQNDELLLPLREAAVLFNASLNRINADKIAISIDGKNTELFIDNTNSAINKNVDVVKINDALYLRMSVLKQIIPYPVSIELNKKNGTGVIKARTDIAFTVIPSAELAVIESQWMKSNRYDKNFCDLFSTKDVELITTYIQDYQKPDLLHVSKKEIYKEWKTKEGDAYNFLGGFFDFVENKDYVARVSPNEWVYPMDVDDPVWQWSHICFVKINNKWVVNSMRVNFSCD